MEEVKKFLTTSENQLRLANNKLEDVSVKKIDSEESNNESEIWSAEGGVRKQKWTVLLT